MSKVVRVYSEKIIKQIPLLLNFNLKTGYLVSATYEYGVQKLITF